MPRSLSRLLFSPLPLLTVLCALLAAPAVAHAQLAAPPPPRASTARRRPAPIPPWRRVAPDAATAARVEGVLARYAFEEREGRDGALVVGAFSAAAMVAGGVLFAIPREAGGGGTPLLGVPFFVLGALCATGAALFRLPGAFETLRDRYRADLRAAPAAPAPLVLRTEAQLAQLARATTSLRRIVSPVNIAVSAVSAALGTATVIVAIAAAWAGANVPLSAYVSLPFFGLAAFEIAIDGAVARDDLARRALREARDAMIRAPAVARPQPAL